MSKRKALGKGLRSLIPEAPPQAKPSKPAAPPAIAGAAARTAARVESGVREFDLDRIHPNPRQPRQQFDQEALAQLAESLRRQGLLQPVVVRPRDDGDYELVAGERRWRAAQLAGLMRVPALVRDVDDARMLELALIENIQREELNPIETAQAYQTLMDDLGMTQQEIAERLGKPRSSVANATRLLNLVPQVQRMVVEGKISAGHAKPLVAVSDPRRQREIADQIVAKQLTVRQTEALTAGSTESAKSKRSEVDPNVAAAEEALQRAVGTRVRIVQKANGKGGRIELHVFSSEEMDRLYQLLLDGAR